MRILYVVSRPLEINSSASIRNINTINELAKEGHYVDVITSQYDINHKNYSKVELHNNVDVEYLNVSGIKKAASITNKYKKFNKIKVYIYKLLKKNEVYDNLKCIINKIPNLDFSKKEYDLVISSADPKSSHLFVYELFRQNKLIDIPWIQIWGDPFLSDITRTSNKINSKIFREESKLLERANKILYLSEMTVEDQKSLYPKYSNKMGFMPRPYQNELIYNNTFDEEADNLLIVYCGDYNSNVRNIKPLYNAIKNTKHKLIICGATDIKLEECNNIEIHERVPYQKVLEYEAKADILVHVSNLKGTQIPGKIYHYSSTNKPILFILDGEKDKIKKVFEKYNRYEFCINEEESIINATTKIKNKKTKVVNEPVKEFKGCNVVKNLLNLEFINNINL